MLMLLVGCNKVQNNGIVFDGLDIEARDNILHLLRSLKDDYKIYDNIIFSDKPVDECMGGRFYEGEVVIYASDNGSIITATTLCHEILHKKGFTHGNMNGQDIQLVCFDFDKLNNKCKED